MDSVGLCGTGGVFARLLLDTSCEVSVSTMPRKYKASARRGLALWRMISGHPEVVYRIHTDRPVLALTIDDGPDRQSTPRILDLLARYRAKATFFVISERVAGNESLMERIVSDGHEIGNHMIRDEPSIDLSAKAFEDALLDAHRTLSEYARARWFRPGSGWYNHRMLAVLKKHDYVCVLGTIYPFDTLNSFSWLAGKVILTLAEPGGNSYSSRWRWAG